MRGSGRMVCGSGVQIPNFIARLCGTAPLMTAPTARKSV
jgi:hypothetical protein